MGYADCAELGTLAIFECDDFTDIADDADYIQLPKSVNMISAVRVPQVYKNTRIYPPVRKLPAGFSLWKRRSLVRRRREMGT
ncbi:MAG: hypothetical protein V4719_17120 [Planctomycetota bacterium]